MDVHLLRHWPKIRAEQIKNYLVHWDLDELGDKKAYPDDQHSIGEDWQLVDFMKKLGLDYPIGDDGIAGKVFRFSP